MTTAHVDARRAALLLDLIDAPAPRAPSMSAQAALTKLRSLPFHDSDEAFWHAVREVIDEVRADQRGRIDLDVAAYLRARCSPWGPWQMKTFRAGIARLIARETKRAA